MRSARIAAAAGALWTVFLGAPRPAQAEPARSWTYVDATTAARYRCGGPEASWRTSALDDRGWTRLERPDAGTTTDAGATCAGTRYVRWHFMVGPERAQLATLTLRVRYAHGFAAYLNGREIARARLAPDAPDAGLATEWHGPEFQRFSIPITEGMLEPGDNLLAIEVHPKTLGQDAGADAELRGSDQAAIVRGPWLARPASNGIEVLFDTDLPTTAELRFGATAEYGSVLREEVPRQHHVLHLGPVSPGQTVHYRVLARGRDRAGRATIADSGDLSFRVPRAQKEGARFVVYGDVRSGHEIHAQINRAILADAPEFVLVTGDLVDNGADEAEWEKYFEVAGPLLRSTVVIPAPGNHDAGRMGRGSRVFQAEFRPEESQGPGRSYYSIDLAGLHVVVFDTNRLKEREQLTWLEADLTDAHRRGLDDIIVFSHEGPYMSGLHGDNQLAIRELVPILEHHQVRLYFYGHDHHYERGRVGSLDYLVTGGGGAPLRAQRCGAPGLKACGARVRAIANEHHYVLIEVSSGRLRLCPKRPDGTPLEACTDYPLARARRRGTR